MIHADHLDLADIQGNIHRPYGRFGFPHTRHLFFNIADPAAGRAFVDAVRGQVTTAEPWDAAEDSGDAPIVKKPPITMNIGFSYHGLQALALPTRTLRMFPDEFIDGMGCRSHILGDVGRNAPALWDPIWRYTPWERDKQVHVWVSLNVGAKRDGSPLAVLGAWTDWLRALADGSGGGVRLLPGNGPAGELWQDCSARMATLPDGSRAPTPKEHFGYTDGISDPTFHGQFADGAEKLAAIGGGKIAPGMYDQATSWSALQTGEFILGHADEGQETALATTPFSFAANGTFMVWRKLRQDVEAFEGEMRRQARLFMQVAGVDDEEAAYQTVCAKVVGRWKSGLPLSAAPTWAEHQKAMAAWQDCLALELRTPRNDLERARLAEFDKMLTGFRYADDPQGGRCPLGAHIRRANPRDMLDPELKPEAASSALTNRRRILRRGLPYEGDGEKGVVFMALCSSLFRQFEFIQQQWMQYGLDFEAGNDTCPLLGIRQDSDKHVIPAGEANATPFIAAGLPQFVATRGGEYFFIPSMTALRQIAMGTVDPT